MAFSPYSHGKSHPQEMAQSGISGTTHPLSDGSRYPTRWNYLTGPGEYDVGWSGTDADATLPQGQNRKGSPCELRQICRRLSRDWENERTASARSSTAY